MGRIRRSLVCLVLTTCGVALTHAQEFRATVKGRVVDTSHAAFPGATVALQNVETNELVSATTNDGGHYTVPFLRPGAYRLTVEASGFEKYTRPLRLEVGQTATIDVELRVGAVTEQITVEVPLLSMGKADRGTVIDNRRVTELPLNARNPFMLSTLVAGVNYNGAAVFQRPFDNGAIADWSINGGQNRNNEFLLDGAPNNAIRSGNNIAYVPPVDSVQEFKIMTNSYDAQYGRSAGGAVNVSLKTGTNMLHGTVYEFLRRRALDANSFLLNARSAERADHFLDQYGFQLDGPVQLPGVYSGRDKTFFLVQYEGYREGTPNPLVGSTPTEAMRRGDFSDLRDSTGRLITIYDPASGRLENGVWVRDPFPGNRIPDDRINPAARRLAEHYPLPNTSTAGSPAWQNNLADLEHIARDKFYNFLVKVDHNFSARDRVFVRFAHNRRREIRSQTPVVSGPAAFGQLPQERVNHAGVADWVHTLGASAIFNMRASVNRFVEDNRTDPGLGFDATELGMPRSLADQLPGKYFPRVDIDEFIRLGRGGRGMSTSLVYSVQPNVSMFKGNHSLRFGADLRHTRVGERNTGDAGMRLEFTRGFTQREFNRADTQSGNAFASMLLGALSATNSGIDNNVLPNYAWNYAAPWIQDDWKVTSRLTVNLGLRWDLNTPPIEEADQMNYVFDPDVVNPVSARINQTRFPGYSVKGGLTFAGVGGNPRRPWSLDQDNIQARLGATYQLNDDTVLRAGYGRFYMNPTGVGFTQGFSIRTPLVASLDGGRTSVHSLANPFPAGVLPAPGAEKGLETFLGSNIGYADAGFAIPNVDQFSIGFERRLPWNVVVEASYVGSRTRQEQTSFGQFNEPSLAFVVRCDATRGGNRAFCDERLPNPFFGVPGFEGTTRGTSDTISRYDLNRPYPQFGTINVTELNEGRIWYDSVQLVVNRRSADGLTLNGTYTYVPRFLEEAGYIDGIAGLENRSPYLSHRKHRITASAVWQLPFGRGKSVAGAAGGVLDRLIGGWEVAGSFIFQSGRPWDLPTGVEMIGDPSVPVDRHAGQYITGVQPCVGQLRNGVPELTPNSVAAGCTQAFFVTREPFQTRTIMNRDDRLRRPSFQQLDVNFAKTTRISQRVRLQMRIEAFNVFNSAMYDERDYNTTTTSVEFGKINKNATAQSNFPRFVQLGFKLIF